MKSSRGRTEFRIKVGCVMLGVTLLALSCNLPTEAPTGVLAPTPMPAKTATLASPSADVPTNTAEPSLIPTVPPPPTVTPLPTARPALGVFTWAVIVDLDSEPVTREQAQELVNQAGAILMELTGFSYAMVDFVESTSPGTVNDLAVACVRDHAGSLPNGIIVFSYGDGNSARIYGGYAYTLMGPSGFRNAFNSPVVGNNQVYVSVQHWSHRYAACGYGSSDVEGPVQDTSFGGECRNRDGITCVEKNGYSMCSDAVGDRYASSRTYFGSSVIIHETMHSFGPAGNMDHYGAETCNTRMASGMSDRSYNPDTWDLAEFQYYNGMCPDVYDNFVSAYQP